MTEFFIGVVASLSATALVALVVKWGWPTFQSNCLYKGVKVAGEWDIVEVRNGKNITAGRITLQQVGSNIAGSSIRSKTRDGKKSERKFSYKGTIFGNQVTLMFEDHKGVGFDTGTYVFTVQNDHKTMIGMATFHGKSENKIVSESRTLKKVLS
ncbi:hypothetical protein [Vibrio vulnificus]|uniref:hypothetical protein n=1 Tax=Vibrio vulnificus TaxID=672 RepID=UPI0005FAEE01|nr:hypothetical protein [Vibrio vulnificus]OJI56175.1 hypothetical protein VFL11327_03394 [Vibrio fluvialis]EJR3606046.1 hypothetical protein [Vibrio vulnificus]OJI56251.1 hypothetical protein VV1062A_01647 [Vibrio vulnificus]POB24117.1 hypothetical protein CRN47_13255 [Vibrio vulnificus]RZP64488.1 hypothetical protein D8T45_14155 [Vibrio vulnificus]